MSRSCNTQNNNESYNNLVWRITPKSSFSGKEVLEIASWIAACTFNEGANTFLIIKVLLGFKIGETAKSWAESINGDRILLAVKRSTEQSKEGRIQRKK